MNVARTGAGMPAPVRHVQVLIVGSGGNGIALACLMMRVGYEGIVIMTKHSDFGGAWLQNTYPGCEVDSPSSVYQFEFEPNPQWSSLFVGQAELLDYLRDVAGRHGLYEQTMFSTEFLQAHWSDVKQHWSVQSSQGRSTASIVIVATGFLEEPAIPSILGMDEFFGPLFHSSMWPMGYTGGGDRVAVVGSGSSAIQIVPGLQSFATEVIQFQRTPTWVFPKMNRRLSVDEIAMLNHSPSERERRRVKAQQKEERNWSPIFLNMDKAATEEYEKISRDFLLQEITDPRLRALLTPDHSIGCRRPLVSNDYYASLKASNVRLIASPVAGLGAHSVITVSGESIEVDAVVLATGFHLSGHILDKVNRRDCSSVAGHQRGRPRAYKAISAAECPNLFLVGGAAPNGQIWNGLYPGQAAVSYIFGALDYMRDEGVTMLEVTEDAEMRWKFDADSLLDHGPTVIGGCMNYSQDEEGHNKAAWPGSLESMRKAYASFDPTDYRAIAEMHST